MKYSDEYLITETNKYKTKKEFREDNPSLYDAVYRRKLFEKTDIKGQNEWTLDKLLNISRKYKTLMEFKRKESKAYNACKSLNLYKEVTKHLIRKTKNITIEDCLTKALSYNHRSDFQKDYPSHYRYIRLNNLQSKAYSHMFRKQVVSRTLETYRNDRTILYYIKINNVYKVGIYKHYLKNTEKNILRRYTSHKLAKNVTIEIIDYKIYEDGYYAALYEQEILRMYKDKKYLGEKFITENGKSGGETECFVEDIYENIKSYFV